MAQTKNPDEVRTNRLFSGIYDLKYNFKDKNFLEFKEGDVIYSKGDDSEYIYLVVNGRIKFKSYENPRQPKVYLISKNEFFGEKELIDKVPRDSSALAEKESLLFRINYKDFFKISSSNRKILQNLTEKKYEEVVPATRATEFRQDIFQRLMMDVEPSEKTDAIEIKDYPEENPLLEIKAKEEITEDFNLYEEEPENSQETEKLIDDEGIIWETDDTSEDGILQDKILPDEAPPEENIKDEILPAGNEEIIIPEPQVDDVLTEEEIMKDFQRLRDEVANFNETISHAEFISKFPSTEKVSVDKTIPSLSYLDAIIKITSGKNTEETEKLIIQACCELLDADTGILFQPDENNILKGRLYENDLLVEAHPESIPAKCFNEDRLINIRDVFDDPDFNPSYDYLSDFQVHSILSVPIKTEEKTFILELFNNQNGEFTETEELLLQNMLPVIINVINKPQPQPEKIIQAEIPVPEPLKVIPQIVDMPLVIKIGESPVLQKTKEIQPAPQDKKVLFKTLSEFLLKEFQVVVSDVRQFNNYLQRTDISGEAKEIADIVTNETAKMIDLLEALKAFADVKNILSPEKLSYISLVDDMVLLLAEYTEGRKVNLFKKLGADAYIMADPKYLYLALLQLIKYQCNLMPFGGNIFISSEVSENRVEIILRNATKRTDETLVVSPAIDFNENTLQGLGLSLAKRIIENHDAVLDIKNQSGTGIQIGLIFQTH